LTHPASLALLAGLDFNTLSGAEPGYQIRQALDATSEAALPHAEPSNFKPDGAVKSAGCPSGFTADETAALSHPSLEREAARQRALFYQDVNRLDSGEGTL
jgi:hypothetical protein